MNFLLPCAANERKTLPTIYFLVEYYHRIYLLGVYGSCSRLENGNVRIELKQRSPHKFILDTYNLQATKICWKLTLNSSLKSMLIFQIIRKASRGLA